MHYNHMHDKMSNLVILVPMAYQRFFFLGNLESIDGPQVLELVLKNKLMEQKLIVGFDDRYGP